jgi:DNA modification methylase
MPTSNKSKMLSSGRVQPASEIVLKSPYALRRNSRNARTHSKKQIRQIANSIDRFGFTAPVLVDSDCVILAGHGRVEAAKLLNLKTIPVIAIDHLSDAEKRVYILTDNKTALNAGWDQQILETELSELLGILPDEGMDLTLTGFGEAEVDGLLLNSGSDRAQPSDENIPEIPAKPVTQLDDMWEAGKHRIICGDARLAETFKRLMRGKKAIMVFTDPPYNVPIAGHVGGRGRTKHREFAVGVGELSSREFREFLENVLDHCAEYSVNGSIHYVCMDWRHTEELSAAGRAVYSTLKNICVWVKNNAGQGSFYRSQHELVFVFKNGDGEHINTFELGQHGRTRTNVWNYAGVNSFRAGRLDELRMHPTVKPTALVADALRDCSKRGSIVLDAFLGSGTTLIAAEQLGRLAYSIELDPAYVDVAIERWQKMTGRDAVLAGTSLTFDELRRDPSLRHKLSTASRTERRGSR